MYYSIIQIVAGHDPIVIEGNLPTQALLFNAGPSTIQAKVWNKWNGKTRCSYSENSDEANLNLEIRPGDQRVVHGSLIRLKGKANDHNDCSNWSKSSKRYLL